MKSYLHRTRKFEIRPAGILISAVTLMAISGAAQEKVPPAAADKWAGKPVKDMQQASELIAARFQNAPKVGDQAPGFTVTDAVNGRHVTLAELHKDKPVVLLFTSYSCSVAHQGGGEISLLSKRFGDLANFALIYIQEAHTRGGVITSETGEGFVVEEQETFAERTANALRLAREKNFEFTVLADSMDDPIAVRWAAWPIRLYVVDRSGRVTYAGGQGPWYFRASRNYAHYLDDVPEGMGNIPGYNMETLEEYLEALQQLSKAR